MWEKVIMKGIPYTYTGSLNSFPASGDFCRLLITLANSLDPDQACWAWSGSKPFDTDGILERFFWKSKFKKKILQTTKKHAKLPGMQRREWEWNPKSDALDSATWMFQFRIGHGKRNKYHTFKPCSAECKLRYHTYF